MEDEKLHCAEVETVFERMQEAGRGVGVHIVTYALGLLLACCIIDARAGGEYIDLDEEMDELREVVEYGLKELKDREHH